ncbi:MAG: alpha-amylase [Candidatus Aenigmarchaeota archaeon ex4484_56]|nr:MAG: alpha-amylase [Candidatus Aenigmarchaeota archaeon ex4484_56]
MVSVCFYLHVHQPVRLRNYKVFDIGKNDQYFDEWKNKLYLDRIIKKSYLPTNKILLDLIHKTDGKFKVSFSITGILLEQLENYPYVFESFKKIIDTGCCDLVSETYYHSLASVFSHCEFKEQIKLQEKKLKEILGIKPKIFRNTELVYSNDIGKIVSEMDYKAVLVEGADKILGWRSPCFIYRGTGSNIKLLLKHYKLSDDIAFRFSERSWVGWPLTADKFASWITSHNGNGHLINLFMDYETFGEHQWEETGIFKFLEKFPLKILENGDDFVTPSEAIKKFEPIAELDFPYIVSWADTERDLSAWIGNKMQQSAIREIYRLEKDIVKYGDRELIDKWRKLQISDHFYYMCTKWFADGDVHKYFNPYNSPYDSFIIFMNILNDLKLRLDYIKKEKTNYMDKSFLNDVEEGKEFYCANGRIIRNLRELAEEIKKLDFETFVHHVNEEKNDLANWIRDVVGDIALASRVNRAKKPETIYKAIRSRIAELSFL